MWVEIVVSDFGVVKVLDGERVIISDVFCSVSVEGCP